MSTTLSPSSRATEGLVDPRGQRLAASLTTAVFAVVLLAPVGLATALLAVQLIVFTLGVTRGPAATPYAWVFKRFVRPRLAAPREWEDARPPRFAQAVGLGFTAVALTATVAGLGPIAAVAAGFALAAAVLNAAFGYCLGCELYLLGRRLDVRAA